MTKERERKNERFVNKFPKKNMAYSILQNVGK